MSNLLDRASILLTPTSVSQHRIHSVKPIQTFGSELITNGSYDADSNWQGSGGYPNNGWAISNGVANFDTNDGTGNFSQSSVHTIGKQYVLDCDAEITSGRLKYESPTGINPNMGAQSAAEIFSGKNRIYYTAETTSAIFRRFNTPAVGFIDNVSIRETIDGDFDFTRATTATRVNSSGLIESVASGLPRIDFLGGTGQILLEPASTNTATYSNDFSQGTNFNSGGRTLSDCVLSSSQGTAPDGTNTAQKLTDNNNSGTGAISFNSFGAGLTSDTDSTVSMFVKKDTVRYFVIKFSNFDTNQETSFDLDTATVNRGTGVMTDYGNGWYRCSATFSTTTDLVGAIQFLITNSSSSTGGNLRDGSNSTFVWGYQAEETSFATSYIPTVASTVTRNKDEANSSGDTSLISSTEGVLYAEIAALTDDSIVRSIALASAGAITNTVEIIYNTTSQTIHFRIRANNSVIGSVAGLTVTDRTQFAKAAIKYKSGEIKAFINGVQVLSATDSFTFSDALAELDLDRGNETKNFEGKVKCVAVFKEFLDNDELECLTGSGFDSFTALAEAGSYTII